MRIRFAALVGCAALVGACATPDSERYPLRDDRGERADLDPNSCFASIAARRYLHEMREKVYEEWRPPSESRRGAHTVRLVFWIGPGGEVENVYTKDPSDPIAASAVAAFERAAPFGAVPAEALCLTEEHFQAKFTFEVGAPPRPRP